MNAPASSASERASRGTDRASLGPSPTATSEPPTSKTHRLGLALVFGGLALTYLALVFFFERGVKAPTPAWFKGPAFNAMRMDLWLGVCAALGFAGLVVWGGVRRSPRVHTKAWRRGSSLVLVLLVCGALLISFWGRKVQRRNFTQMWDTYHYALGPKYFPELGYFGLYDCTAQVLGPRSFRNNNKRPVRDLRTYGTMSGKKAMGRKCLEKHFADPVRRKAFEDDIALFIELEGRRRVKSMLHDHGYNGAPVHAALSGSLARAIPLTPDSLPMLVSIDGVLLLLMLFVIARAYGWRAGLVFALFFLTHIVDRNKSIGAGFIRYSWMVSLGISIACLHRKKMGWGAFFLVLASMLNVFPLLFGVGVVIRGAADWVRERSLNADFRRFLIVGALATGVVGLGSAASGRGAINSYAEFFDNMRIHAEGPPNAKGERRERIPGFGVGLKFTFMYRGEYERGSSTIRSKGKSKQYREIKPWVQGLALLMTLCCAAVATRLSYAEAAIWFGFGSFYCLQGTVAYYFTCASLVWLLWHQRRRKPGAYLMALSFWGISLLGYWNWLSQKHDPLLFNTVMSMLWFFYIWATNIYLGVDTGLLRDLGRRVAPPAWRGANAALTDAAATPQSPKQLVGD